MIKKATNSITRTRRFKLINTKKYKSDIVAMNSPKLSPLSSEKASKMSRRAFSPAFKHNLTLVQPTSPKVLELLYNQVISLN